MNEIQAILPGWKGKIKIDELICYSVDFNRDDLDFENLNYYIRKGEYRSSVPIAIQKHGKSYYIITNTNEIPDRIIVIQNNIGKVAFTKSKMENISLNAIKTLLHSIVDLILIEHGYESPKKVRTFLGKSSKGKLSYRQEIYNTFKTSLNKNIETFNIYKSVSIQVFICENLEFKITCLPNFELYNQKLDLPISEKMKREFEENEKYISTVFMNPKVFMERFEEYNNILKKYFTKLKMILEFEQLNEIAAKILKRNEDFLIKPMSKKIKINPEVAFDIQILEYFQRNIEVIPKIDIIILVDNLVTKEVKNGGIINNFLKSIKKNSIFEIKEIINFTRITELNLDESEKYLFVIDDNSPGTGYIYDYIKKNTQISKGITFSTIKNIKDLNESLLILWLSLYFRIFNQLSWFKSKKYQFQDLRIIRGFLDYNNQNIRIIDQVLDLSKFTIKKKNRLFNLPENTDENNSIDEIINVITESILNEYEESKENRLFMFTDDFLSSRIMRKISHHYTCVMINKVNCRLFQQTELHYDLPQNGLSTKILDESNIYLLITTGLPDHQKGLPNPIQIEIANPNNIENETILQLIFDLTFYNPISFKKTNLPFIIDFYNDQLFRRVPIKYNEEEPF